MELEKSSCGMSKLYYELGQCLGCFRSMAQIGQLVCASLRI